MAGYFRTFSFFLPLVDFYLLQLYYECRVHTDQMWLPFPCLALFSLPGMFFGFPYLLSYLYLFPLSEELCLINTHITKSTVCQIVEQDSVQWQVNWLKSRGVLLDVRSALRPPGDSEALVAGGQAGGDKWACCTWGTRCESLTILADTCINVDRHEAKTQSCKVMWKGSVLTT